MKYRLQSQGQNSGTYTLDELERRRAAGELTGAEFVWCEGMATWDLLDSVLQRIPAAAKSPKPPPLPARVKRPSYTWAWITGGVLVVAGFVVMGLAMRQFTTRVAEQLRTRIQHVAPRTEAIELASRPLPSNTNSLTEGQVRNRGREFRLRQWVEGYQQRGRRQHPLDAEALLALQTWIAITQGGQAPTNQESLQGLCDKLAGSPDFNDPLALCCTAVNCAEFYEVTRRLERAFKAFEGSGHRAYPKLYASVMLAKNVSREMERVVMLDGVSVAAVRAAFADGSITSRDEEEMGDIFVRGWGEQFFQRNLAAVVGAVRGAGKDYEWLALVLEGEQHIADGWRARGGGYADTVTASGWEEFGRQMREARRCFTRAYCLQPARALAPARMVYVAMGDGSLADMRLWFDRTLAIQIDHPSAWSNFRWGLRPRWYGDQNAMLALGVAALNSKRFDTEVPRFFMQSVTDVASEMGLMRGQHLFGRADIWPNVQRMYEGYLAAPSQWSSEAWWRTMFAVVATRSGKYAIARTQLEKLEWKPLPTGVTQWSADVSLMPLEVAAHTGPLGEAVEKAEALREQNKSAGALKLYNEMKIGPAIDDRTRKFIQHRVAALELERKLEQGEWVDVLPASDDDPNWVVVLGKARRLPDGALEVRAGADGHYCYSRVRVCHEYEVQGEFEVMHSSNGDFQAGLIMGIPDITQIYDWNGFRLKHNKSEPEGVSYSRGWSTFQNYQPVPLGGLHHTFNFTMVRGKATAKVNGQQVFHNLPVSQNKSPELAEIVLGVGAYNDLNETVIRYHSVRVRKVPAR